ncbi:MAG: PepSY-associated TM helix domain-containing protein [Salinibacter sp.]
MSTVRRVSSWLHLYGGLALGGLLIVISVSGSALVFKDTLDRRLRPDLLRVAPGGERVSLDRVMDAVQAAHPEAQPRLIEMPFDAAAPVTVWLAGDNRHVYVDPYRGRVLGARAADAGVMNTISRLHISLLAGDTGLLLVGVVGLLLIVITLTGLVLWWPRRLRALGTALRVAWRHGALRVNYDLHRAGGFYTTLFLLLTALTGSAFAFYPTTQQFIATITASEPWPPAPPTVETPPDSIRGPSQVDYEAGLRAALDRLPGAEPSFVYVPQTPTDPLTVRLRTPPEWHPNGRSFVHLHPTRTSVLRVDDAREAPGGAQLLQTFYPLHVGAVGGLVGQWLYVLLGLAPAILSVTGTIIWYRRWRRTPVETTDDEAEPVGTRPVELPPRSTAGPSSEAVPPDRLP